MKLLLFCLALLFGIPIVAKFVVWAVNVMFDLSNHFPTAFILVFVCLILGTILVND